MRSSQNKITFVRQQIFRSFQTEGTGEVIVLYRNFTSAILQKKLELLV